jgi:hypothetical protein
VKSAVFAAAGVFRPENTASGAMARAPAKPAGRLEGELLKFSFNGGSSALPEERRVFLLPAAELSLWVKTGVSVACYDGRALPSAISTGALLVESDKRFWKGGSRWRAVLTSEIASVQRGHKTRVLREAVARGWAPLADQCFSVVTTTRTLDLAAATGADAARWIAALEAAAPPARWDTAIAAAPPPAPPHARLGAPSLATLPPPPSALVAGLGEAASARPPVPPPAAAAESPAAALARMLTEWPPHCNRDGGVHLVPLLDAAAGQRFGHLDGHDGGGAGGRGTDLVTLRVGSGNSTVAHVAVDRGAWALLSRALALW